MAMTLHVLVNQKYVGPHRRAGACLFGMVAPMTGVRTSRPTTCGPR
jgi:hypothetical protein